MGYDQELKRENWVGEKAWRLGGAIERKSS
jgi:hypothetical protein